MSHIQKSNRAIQNSKITIQNSKINIQNSEINIQNSEINIQNSNVKHELGVLDLMQLHKPEPKCHAHKMSGSQPHANTETCARLHSHSNSSTINCLSLTAYWYITSAQQHTKEWLTATYKYTHMCRVSQPHKQ